MPLGLLGKLGDTIGNAVLPGMVVDIFRKYKGPDCKDLRTGILINVDLWRLWEINAEQYGEMTPEKARDYAGMFPNGKQMLTCENLRKWLLQEREWDIVRTIDSTPGGQAWLERTIERFREGLWP
jgi:hypothetical protein